MLDRLTEGTSSVCLSSSPLCGSVSQDPLNRAYNPTTPTDTTDPPRFSQVSETVKDAFVSELEAFFQNSNLSTARRSELPTIQKYATFTSVQDPFTTSVEIIRKHPDILEGLPHVAVFSTTGQERRLAIGPPFVAQVQDPSCLTSPNTEPFAFVDGDTLAFRIVLPKGDVAVERIQLTSGQFPSGDPITAATAADTASEVNAQSCYLKAEATSTGALQVCVRAGPGNRLPREIEIHQDTTANAEAALGWSKRGTIDDIGGTAPSMSFSSSSGSGVSAADIGKYVVLSGATNSHFNDGRFPVTNYALIMGTDLVYFTNKYGRNETGSPGTFFIGDRDDMFQHPPKNRFGMAWDLSVQVNVLSQDENVRQELTDLVAAFFGFFLEEKLFTFMGRSGFPGHSSVTEEHYQIVIQPPVRAASETEIPRPIDGVDKVYVNSFAVDVHVSMYLDREVLDANGNPWVLDSGKVVHVTTLPTILSDEQ